jgi:hypothetical protein
MAGATAIATLRAVEERSPLAAQASHFQRLHLERSDRGQLTHNIQLRWQLRGPVDLDLLEDAIGALAARHEALRTSLQATRRGAVQVIAPRVRITVRPVVPRRREQWRRIARNDVKRPFELAIAPLLRVSVVRFAEQESILVLTVSHAVWDGWSSSIALHEVAATYGALRAGRWPSMPALPLQFADHVAVARQPRPPADEYWRHHLRGYRSLVPPTPYRPGSLSFAAASAPVAARLAAVARHEGATVAIALIAALFVLLWLVCGRRVLHVAFNDANRDEPCFRNVIGPFLGFFVIAAELGPTATLASAMRRARDGVLGAYAHRADVDSQLPGNESRWSDPRYPVIDDAWINFFPFVDRFAAASRTMRAADLSIRPLGVDGAADARWNDGALGFTLVQSASGALDGTAVYNTALIDRKQALRFAAAYSQILRAMAVDGDRSLGVLRTQRGFDRLEGALACSPLGA